jgi:hypothetical protein
MRRGGERRKGRQRGDDGYEYIHTHTKRDICIGRHADRGKNPHSHRDKAARQDREKIRTSQTQDKDKASG